MIILKLKDDGINVEPPRRVLLMSGVELWPDIQTHRVLARDEAEAEELEQRGWTRVATSKAMDSETLQKSAHVATRRAGFKIADKIGDDDLRRLAKAAEYHRHTGGHEPPEREQVDFGEVDAGSFGRLRTRHDVLHGELSIGGVNSDVGDLDPDLRDAFIRASGGFIDSIGDIDLQASAKVTISALVAAILSRHGHIADAVRRQKFRAKVGV